MAIVVAMTPVAALAGESITVLPMQVGAQTIRYRQGVGTVEQVTPNAIVDVTPLGFDHGALTFGLSIFNASARSANIDISDVSGTLNGEKLRLRSTDELIKMAKSRAMWSQIGIALLAGAAAGAAASQRDYSSGSLYTPRGAYTWTYSQPSAAGQIAAVGATVGGIYAIDRVQQQLDLTIDRLGNSTLQLNTIEAGQGFGARIVFTKPKQAKWPQVFHMVIKFNSDEYSFDMDIGKSGRPAPVFAPVAAVVAAPKAEPAVTSIALPPASTPSAQPSSQSAPKFQ